MSRETEIQALLDKQAIAELLSRYCRAVDRADIDLLKACYHPDATEDHRRHVQRQRHRLHRPDRPHPAPRRRDDPHTANLLIELDGDTARAESHILAFARLKKDGEKFDTLTLARAIDALEKRDGVWRIAARRMVWEWNHEMPMAETWGRGLIAPDATVLVRGAKTPNDRLYTS